jgi:hypothetical protein
VSTKDLQNGANAAAFSLPFCARNDFFNDSNRGGKCAWRALEALMEMQILP